MISVIIPTCNEAGYLTATLDSVADSKSIREVIVVDAGSVDGTGDLARSRASRVLFSPWRQRAYQMNLGARHAHGEHCCSCTPIPGCLLRRSTESDRLYRMIE